MELDLESMLTLAAGITVDLEAASFTRWDWTTWFNLVALFAALMDVPKTLGVDGDEGVTRFSSVTVVVIVVDGGLLLPPIG